MKILKSRISLHIQSGTIDSVDSLFLFHHTCLMKFSYIFMAERMNAFQCNWTVVSAQRASRFLLLKALMRHSVTLHRATLIHMLIHTCWETRVHTKPAIISNTPVISQSYPQCFVPLWTCSDEHQTLSHADTQLDAAAAQKQTQTRVYSRKKLKRKHKIKNVSSQREIMLLTDFIRNTLKDRQTGLMITHTW